MSRRLVWIRGLVVLLFALGAWGSVQAQVWPYCNSGCNAGEVQVTGSTFTLLDPDTGRVVVQTDFNSQRYCVVLAVSMTYTPLGALVPVTTVFETQHGTQASGAHDLIGATFDFEPGTQILVNSIYLLWDQNTPPGGVCPYGNCTAYGGANSKCTTTTTTPYSDLTPPTVIVEKTTTPAGGSGFSFAGTGFPTSCSFATFTLDDGQTKTCNSLAAGQYEVRESALPASWQIAGISVITVGAPIVEMGNSGGYDGDDAYNVGDDRVRVMLGAHDTVRITFSNAQILATPVLTTTPSAGGAVGTVLNDTATLTGGNAPTGAVTFKLYDPDQATCTGTPRYTVTDASAPYATSPGFTTDKAGTWRWVAEYAGDANNNPVTSGCNDEEVSIVNGSAITVTKDVSPNDASEWTITLTLPGGSQHPVHPALGDGESYTFSELASGTYMIEENDSGQYLSSVSCATCSGTGRSASVVVSNQTVVDVLFTNTRRPPSGGGGSSGSSGGTVGFGAPVPTAGPDQTSCLGELICLRGQATDPEQGVEGLRFQWSFSVLYYLNGVPVLQIPAGSQVLETLRGFDTATPCFVTDVAGDYVLVLTVTDRDGLSTMDSVTVRAAPCGEVYACPSTEGWNLLSITAQPLNPEASTILQGTNADSPALVYSGGRYVEAETLSPTQGFWVHFVAPDSLSFVGREIRNDVTLILENPGWHLISSPFAIEWERVLVFVDGAERYVSDDAARDVIDGTCACYDSDARVYRVSRDVLPCQGYWVRTVEPNVTLKLRWSGASAALGLSGCEGQRTENVPAPPSQAAAAARAAVLAYPNPVRHSTVHFEIPGDALIDKVKASVYSLAGELVWEGESSGNLVDWEPRDAEGARLPWGPYAYCVFRWQDGAWIRSGCGVVFLLESDG